MNGSGYVSASLLDSCHRRDVKLLPVTGTMLVRVNITLIPVHTRLQSHRAQVTKNAGKGSILAYEPRADVTKSLILYHY